MTTEENYDPEMVLLIETVQQLGEMLVKVGETLQTCARASSTRILNARWIRAPYDELETPKPRAESINVQKTLQVVQDGEVKTKKASPPKQASHPLSAPENTTEDTEKASETSSDDQTDVMRDLFGG